MLTVGDLKSALEFFNDDLLIVIPFLRNGQLEYESPYIEPTEVECTEYDKTHKFLVLHPPSVNK